MRLTSLDAWLQRISEIHPVGWDLGLERVSVVADRLDLRHPARQVVLVAGTNGKGSTCEYLARMASAAGLSHGKSTSPHLVRFNERIVVDHVECSDGEIISAFQQIDSAREDTTLSYFEFATLASLLIFKAHDLDLAILEVGLGGRLDAMNLVQPDLTIITQIAMDHEAWLGDTREAIAREKAGIMRPGVPCIIADREPPASLQEVALQCGTPLDVLDPGEQSGLDTRLPLDSYRAARRACGYLGIELAEQRWREIAGKTTLAGRRSWLKGPFRILADVAHNPAAAAALADDLATLSPAGEVHALFGAYADKDIEGVLAPFHGAVKTWHFTALAEQRAALPDEIVRRSGIGADELIHTYAKISDALQAIERTAGKNDLLLVFGSFPVVAGALQRYTPRE